MCKRRAHEKSDHLGKMKLAVAQKSDSDLGCHPQTQNTEPHFPHHKQHHLKSQITHRISPTDKKVRAILYSRNYSPTEKYCSLAFVLMVKQKFLEFHSTDSMIRTTSKHSKFETERKRERESVYRVAVDKIFTVCCKN